MNPSVGDKVVKLGDVEYVLHPDFTAFGEIEALCPEGVHRLFKKSLEIVVDSFAGLGLRETAAVLYACIKSGQPAKHPSFQEVGGLLVKHGYRQHAALCAEILGIPFPSPDRVQKKTEAATQEQTSPASAGTTSSASPSPSST